MTNQMVCDPVGVFNSVVATTAAGCVTIVIFQLLPPQSDRRQAFILERSMAAETRTVVPRDRRREPERRVRFDDRLGTLLSKLPPPDRDATFERTAALGLRLQRDSPAGRRGRPTPSCGEGPSRGERRTPLAP